jgi:hypothetical protein
MFDFSHVTFGARRRFAGALRRPTARELERETDHALGARLRDADRRLASGAAALRGHVVRLARIRVFRVLSTTT